MLLSILLLAVLVFGAFTASRNPNLIAAQPQRLGPVAQSAGEATPLSTGSDGPVEGLLFQTGPVVGQAVLMDVSPPLREMQVGPIEPATTIREMGIPGETERIGPAGEREPAQSVRSKPALAEMDPTWSSRWRPHRW
jgi:hypothetical protein